MASLALQQKSAALLFSSIRTEGDAIWLSTKSQQVLNGEITFGDYVQNLLASSAGNSLYFGQTDSQILTTIYTNVHGVAPKWCHIDGLSW